MKTMTILAFVTLLRTELVAQHFVAGKDEIRAAADICMSRVSNGNADEALSILLTDYWKDKATAPQATATMQRQYREVLGKVEETMSKPIPGGYEFIGAKHLGTSRQAGLVAEK